MKLTSIKTAKETGIPGVEFVIVDKNITEVVIGNVRIRKGESYSQSLQVLIETPFETVERYRCTAEIEGFPPAVSFHEYKHEADSVAAKLEDRGAKTTVEQVTVQLNDEGEIAPAERELATDDLPF